MSGKRTYPTVAESAREVGYKIQRNGVYMTGKHFAVALGETAGKDAAMLVGAGATAFGDTLPGLVAIGATAAISAGLTQMDYIHQRQNLAETYREEMDKKLGQDRTWHRHLEKMAAHNDTIAEELNRMRKQRNFGIGFSFAASLAALAAVQFLLPGVVDVHAMSHVAEFVVKGIVGLVAYNLVKGPLKALGDYFFGLHDETTHDRIIDIRRDRERGKSISREQVLGVFTKANKQLDRMIAAEYGKTYDGMSMAEKKRVAADLTRLLPLDKLAGDINHDIVNPTELAFAVEGDISGVNHAIDPADPQRKGVFTAAWERVVGMFHRHPHGISEAVPSESLPVRDTSVVARQNDGHATANHVKSLGLAKRDPSMTQLERLDARASEPPRLTVQQPV